MAPPRKSVLWQEIKLAKEAGVEIPLSKTYVSYTEGELEELVRVYLDQNDPTPAQSRPDSAPAEPESSTPEPSVARVDPQPAAPRPAQSAPQGRPPHTEWGKYSPKRLAELLGVPLSDNPERRAGLTMYSHGEEDPVRVDTTGRVWFKDEVIKPAIPMPRMRRKLRIMGATAERQETRRPNGALDESFEVAGKEQREMEVKITLPSFQVGIYRDPRLPFKVHQYNGQRGFDRMDVVRYYGGNDLVPSEIGTKYVGGDLCYDIKQTRDAIDRELRQIQLGRMAL